ncbi:AAEL008482-PA [Aedes aegypti]|uniref:Structure-specific endonuclease subunit SLX4 n=1 Tax=Aedes aegypti TaxID=7159 RepID=Q16YM9_AEDAE|nr:AAEL008482-PA [Aedes aegypti]
MSSSAPVENECSEHVDHDNQKDVVVVLSSTDDSNSNPINAPKVNLPTNNLAFPSPGKELSFHALAIRHRLSGVPETEVETIELEDDGSEEENENTSVELGRKSEIEADSDNRQAKKRSSISAIDNGISEKDQCFDKTIFPSAAKELSFRVLSAVNQLNGTTNVDLFSTVVEKDNSEITTTERIVVGNDSFKNAEQSPISEQLVNYSESPSGDDSVQECAHEVEQSNDDVIISSSESMIACNAKQTRNSDDISKDTACEGDIEKDEENCSTERISESFDSPTGDDEPEDVLIISDDEVNYSIRQDFSPFYNVSPLSPSEANPDVSQNIVQSMSRAKDCEDLDGTKVYFDVEDYKRLSSDMNNSAEHQKEAEDAAESTVAPDESNRADNTMAFLDGLIKKFNLPTTLTKQSTCDEPKPPDLEDYMNNYEIPDFPDDPDNNSTDVVDDVQEVPMESSAPIPSEQLDLEIEQILSQARITCTQLEQQQRPRASPIRRTTSDSVLAGPSKRNPSIIKSPIVKRKGGFDDKFEDLTRDRAPPPIDIEIRLDCVSPRPDYERMESPELHRELFKYGMKQLKRRKAVQFLNYIYDQTHPFVEVVDEDECICDDEDHGDGNNVAEIMPRRGDNSVPEMENEEYILPSKPRKKTFWCAVPLHIAFHNMIHENPALRRQMLRYEPIDLDAIYSHLKEIGLRYESNDLISFLDKRCITFRTAQGSGSRTKKTPATQAAR